MMQEHIMYPDNKSKAEAIRRKLALEVNTLNSGTPWRPPSLLEQLNIVDWRDASGDFSLRDADMVWNQLQKDSENSQERWLEAGFFPLICRFSCQMRQRTHPFYCLVMPCLIWDPRQGHHLVLLGRNQMNALTHLAGQTLAALETCILV